MTMKRQNAKTEKAVPTAGADERAGSIARLAYEKWQARGCPDGDDLHDWLEAEQQILTTHAPQSLGAAAMLAAEAHR